MKFNISNTNDGKIVFTFECELTDPMVAVLFDAIKPKSSIEQALQVAEKNVEITSADENIKITRKRRTKAEIEAEKEQRLNARQLNIPFDNVINDPEPIVIPTTKPEDREKTNEGIDRPPLPKPSEIIIPSSVTLKIDINSESDDKMTMDIQALQFMIDGDKLAGIKFVKDISGLDLNSAKTYCDNLWNKHLKENE